MTEATFKAYIVKLHHIFGDDRALNHVIIQAISAAKAKMKVARMVNEAGFATISQVLQGVRCARSPQHDNKKFHKNGCLVTD